MTRKSKRELERAIDDLRPDVEETGPFMGLLAYEPPDDDADYWLTSEGKRIPRWTDVSVVLPNEFHPDNEGDLDPETAAGIDPWGKR